MTLPLSEIDAPAFGRSLTGMGVNLLVRDVNATAQFFADVFGCHIHRVDQNYAIIGYGDQLMQLHQDATYHSNPLPSLMPEAGPRGGGVELHFFETDPDEAVQRARTLDCVVLQEPTDKPHGLREAYILSPDGYCCIASRRLTPTPNDSDYSV